MTIKELYWPELASREDMIRVINHAAGVAFVVGAGTAIVVILQMAGLFNLFAIGPEAFIDAALFSVIGIGILRKSRIAAIAGLLLYVFEQFVMIQGGGGRVGVLMILFTLAFINGVRAAMAYHELGDDGGGSAPAIPLNQLNPLTGQPLAGVVLAENAVPAGTKGAGGRNPFKIIAVAAAFLALAGGAAFAFLGRGAAAPHVMMQTSGPAPAAVDIKAETTALPPAAVSDRADHKNRTFKLKSGETVSGKVIVEDSVYYTVETSLGQQKIVIREDIASEL